MSSKPSRLEGKTIVITGASSGIGRSAAFEFARACPRSLKLVLVARRIDRLDQIASDIVNQIGPGVKVYKIALDVSRQSEACKFLDLVPEEFQDIDILVNNAGLAKGVAKSPNIPLSDMEAMLSTNVTGLIHITQAVLPIFLRRESGGRGDIINIGSIAGRESYPSGSVYCASKAACRAFTDALRRELISTRIRVMEIDPGLVETEFSLVRFDGDAGKAAAVYTGCEPLTPDDIAEVIVFSVTRRENVVVADTLIYPNNQGGATAIHRDLGQ